MTLDLTVSRSDTSVRVGRLLSYEWGARRRPFLHPVATPSGLVVTRDAPADHPWHHGLWFAIKFVNGENFWEEYGDYGVVRHEGPPEVHEGTEGVTLEGDLVWIRPDRTSVALVEHRRLGVVPLGEDAYAIDVSTRLVPEAPVVLDRTPFTTWGGYGGLTLRGPADWHDTRLLLSDGSAHERLEGRPAPWCALAGPVGAGGAVAGVAIFDAPTNPWHPVPWYASTRAATYGDDGWTNFCNAAFLFHGPRHLDRHEPLLVEHRVVVHDGAWSHDRLAAAFADWSAGRA